MKCFRLAWLVAVWFCFSDVASAGLIVTLGTYNLAPNTANQHISINVSSSSGSISLDGMAFYAEIGGGLAGPVFTAVAANSAGMFFHDPTVYSSEVFGVTPDDPTRYASATPFLATGRSLTGESVLVDLTVSTAGVTTGSFDLRVTGMYENSPAFDTQFIYDGELIPFSINGVGGGDYGNINISEVVPEPAVYLQFAVAAAMLMSPVLVRRFRRRPTESSPDIRQDTTNV